MAQDEFSLSVEVLKEIPLPQERFILNQENSSWNFFSWVERSITLAVLSCLKIKIVLDQDKFVINFFCVGKIFFGLQCNLQVSKSWKGKFEFTYLNNNRNCIFEFLDTQSTYLSFCKFLRTFSVHFFLDLQYNRKLLFYSKWLISHSEDYVNNWSAIRGMIFLPQDDFLEARWKFMINVLSSQEKQNNIIHFLETK